MNKGVQMLMKMGALATRIGPGRAAEERARAEMRGLSGVLNLDFTGPDGGGWHVAFDDGRVSMAPGLVDNARATLKVKPDDYLAMLAGDLSYSVARMTGKVRVNGDGHFGIIFGAFIENMRAAQSLKGVRGVIARALIGRALRKGNYLSVKRQA
jgi:putative sterol carrier protein